MIILSGISATVQIICEDCAVKMKFAYTEDFHRRHEIHNVTFMLFEGTSRGYKKFRTCLWFNLYCQFDLKMDGLLPLDNLCCTD